MLRHVLVCAALVLPLSVWACPGADDALYADFDALLRAHVDDQGRVDYPALKARQEALGDVIAALAAVDGDALEGDALEAYWINVYNAVTLNEVLRRYPLRSIKDLAPADDGFHVWESAVFEGKSLNDIEHTILRPLGDPRIHAAIVCASVGCPPLRNEAYLPSTLDAQLDANVRAWLASPERGLKVSGKVAHLSSIFDWFGDDFAQDQPGRLAWIERYVDDETAAQLRQVRQVQSLPWDWTLNGP